jgi:glycosyltransferase involved in cell wall biosynthesis
MHIGIASPFMPHDLEDLLNAPSRALLPKMRGVLATPVTPMARDWHRRGHQLSVFCLDPSVTQAYRLQGERLCIDVLPKRSNRACLPDIYRTERRLLREAIRRAQPEVISAQWTREHAMAALGSGVPTAVTCHDTPLRYAWVQNHWYMWYHVVLSWRVIRRADRLVCVSPYTARHIQRYFRPHSPVDVIPNGLPSEVFVRGQRRLQRAEEPPGRPFTFCCVAGWGHLKNVRCLLHAFTRVHAVEPASRLVLFGPGMGPGEGGEQWACAEGLARGVEFAGAAPRERILDFLETEADLMAHPSLVETHGMVLIEAMACGVPALGGNDSGAVAWTLDEGRCGFLCDIRDPRALAETMHQAMRQPDRNRALARRAWAYVDQHFRLEQASLANESVLRQLRSAGRPA